MAIKRKTIAKRKTKKKRSKLVKKRSRKKIAHSKISLLFYSNLRASLLPSNEDFDFDFLWNSYGKYNFSKLRIRKPSKYR